MKQPRRHHYVPKVYLKNFLADDAKNNQTYVLHKGKRLIQKTEISNVAVEKDFYRIINIKDEFKWENYYSSEVEPLYPRIVKQLSVNAMFSPGPFNFTSGLKDDITEFVVSQLFRTKKAFINFGEIGRRAANETKKELEDRFGDKLSLEQKSLLTNFEVDPNTLKNIELETINNPEKKLNYKDHISSRIWMIYLNLDYSIMPIITSDNPVCMYNVATKNLGFDDNGVASFSTVIFFPINSKILLAMYPKDFFLGHLKPHGNQVLRIRDLPFFWFVNSLQFMQAEQQIYSSSKSTLDLINKVINKGGDVL